jgi:hypothetical protein
MRALLLLLLCFVIEISTAHPGLSDSKLPRMAARAVAKVIASRKVMEGGGFEVRRPFGGGSHIDPFVMVRWG